MRDLHRPPHQPLTLLVLRFEKYITTHTRRTIWTLNRCSVSLLLTQPRWMNSSKPKFQTAVCSQTIMKKTKQIKLAKSFFIWMNSKVYSSCAGCHGGFVHQMALSVQVSCTVLWRRWLTLLLFNSDSQTINQSVIMLNDCLTHRGVFASRQCCPWLSLLIHS